MWPGDAVVAGLAGAILDGGTRTIVGVGVDVGVVIDFDATGFAAAAEGGGGAAETSATVGGNSTIFSVACGVAVAIVKSVGAWAVGICVFRSLVATNKSAAVINAETSEIIRRNDRFFVGSDACATPPTVASGNSSRDTE